MLEIKEFLLSYKKTIITHSIAFLIAVLLFGCGTKTKTQSQSETEIKAKEIALQELSNKKLDSIRVVLEETLRKEFFQKSNETNTEEGSTKTVIEVVETFESPTKNFRPIGGTDLYINDANGRLLTKTTKTIIDERFKAEKKKEIETKRIEEEKRKKDSIATNEYIENVIQAHITQYEKKNKAKDNETIKKGLQLGFWFWFWIILIIILIIAYYVLRKWLLIQFPFLAIIYKK